MHFWDTMWKQNATASLRLPMCLDTRPHVHLKCTWQQVLRPLEIRWYPGGGIIELMEITYSSKSLKCRTPSLKIADFLSQKSHFFFYFSFICTKVAWLFFQFRLSFVCNYVVWLDTKIFLFLSGIQSNKGDKARLSDYFYYCLKIYIFVFVKSIQSCGDIKYLQSAHVVSQIGLTLPNYTSRRS